MQYEDLNDHFSERVSTRVQEKIRILNTSRSEPFEPRARDYFMAVIILIADENDLARAAKRFYELKLLNPATAITFDEALADVTGIYSGFGPEVSMLFDLYQLQEVEQTDIMDIIAHMELRLMEDLEQPAMELPLRIKSTSLRRIQ